MHMLKQTYSALFLLVFCFSSHHFSIFHIHLKVSNYNNVLRVRYFLLKKQDKSAIGESYILCMYCMYVHYCSKVDGGSQFLWNKSLCSITHCIYLIKNHKILFQLKITVFYVNIRSNVIYFCDAQLYFQHHYSSLQSHMIFRNKSIGMILEMVGT